MARLEGQKLLIISRMEGEAKIQKQRESHPNRQDNARAKETQVKMGPKLPVGVRRLGPQGTWVPDGFWREEPVVSTTELPTIRQPWEEVQVQELPVHVNDVKRAQDKSVPIIEQRRAKGP
jgi:hypothetical protein